MSLTESIIRQIIADIGQNEVFETEFGNYTAGTRSKISIQKSMDNQSFIVKELEQDAFSSDEWSKTIQLHNTEELKVYLGKIVNI
ncbi:MAG: hypothetical protein MUE85_04885 [Microscillaceae bacterium]|jgi:lipase chaperone LimK|nr:hypothetical protein [Microscillaceae bacterium]